MKFISLIVLSYLIGCFSSAYFIGKLFKNIDIRGYGSGNVGATNALRVMGKNLGVLTFIIDTVKGIIAVLLGKFLIGANGGMIAGFISVIGHNWPVFIGFKGGKGVATSLGVLLVMSWNSALIAVLIGLFVALITRYVSLGSVSFLITQPLVYYFINKNINTDFIYLSVGLAFLAIIRHQTNFKRLREGTENKLGRW